MSRNIKNISRHKFVCIRDSVDFSVKWEFVENMAKYKHRSCIISFNDLGFSDTFTELYCQEYDKDSSALMSMERAIGNCIYRWTISNKN